MLHIYPISNDATNRRHFRGRRVQLHHQLFQWTITSFPSRIAQCWNILSCILIRRRQAIGYGLKFEIRETLNKVWSMGLDKTVVVELSVHKGYVETHTMKEFG